MSEETAVYQVAKKSFMPDKTRARNYYAAAVSLFQDPTADDCERAIELLNKAVDFYPDFLEAYYFRGDIWHHLLKSLDPDDNKGTYEKYRKSPAWKVKRDAVRRRDGGQCICGAQATEMHHKTYDNIGKEPLSDLVMLCEECHERVHRSRVPSDQQSAMQQPLEILPEEVSVNDDNELYQQYWTKFHAYYTSKGISPEPLGRRENNPRNSYFRMESFDPFHIDFNISFLNDPAISANLNLNKQIDKTQKIFEALKSGQEYFQRCFEDELLFLDDRQRTFIIGCKKEMDIRDPNDWINQFEWLCTNLETLNKVFLPVLRVTQYYEETLLQGQM